MISKLLECLKPLETMKEFECYSIKVEHVVTNIYKVNIIEQCKEHGEFTRITDRMKFKGLSNNLFSIVLYIEQSSDIELKKLIYIKDSVKSSILKNKGIL